MGIQKAQELLRCTLHAPRTNKIERQFKLKTQKLKQNKGSKYRRQEHLRGVLDLKMKTVT